MYPPIIVNSLEWGKHSQVYLSDFLALDFGVAFGFLGATFFGLELATGFSILDTLLFALQAPLLILDLHLII
jgi:hypothetical protein